MVSFFVHNVNIMAVVIQFIDLITADICRLCQFRHLLTLPNGDVLPDPLVELKTGWRGEKEGMDKWPPCMYADIASYLVDITEKSLRERLLTDYKEGKAYSYFDSRWLKEVF